MTPYITKRILGKTSREGTSQTLSGRFSRWIGIGFRRWQRRRMRETLHKLDDRTLNDIGLSRDDIYRLVEGLGPRELRMNPVGSQELTKLSEPKADRLAA